MSSWKAVCMLAALFGTTNQVSAQPQPIRIATWNLGWHVTQEEVPEWIRKCNLSYVKDPAKDKTWKIAGEGAKDAMIGWDIQGRVTLEGLDISKTPPCTAYKTSGDSPKTVAFTEESYKNRVRQVGNLIAKAVKPDVIAFQEVSGTKAVKEALGSAEQEYQICSFDGKYKVQRIAFAWRKDRVQEVEKCRPLPELALPKEADVNQSRPGYQVGLRINGKLVRFLSVHLKSSCVSPLDGGHLDQPKAKDGACEILQKQVAPLEAAVEGLPDGGVDQFIVLGDFNRNLWHEYHKVKGAEPMRNGQDTDLSTPIPKDAATRNLLLEVNDSVPPGSHLNILSNSCSNGTGAISQILCEKSHTEVLTRAETALLGSKEYLGCSFATGLDHILVSDALLPKVISVVKLPLGALGTSLRATKDKSALLSVSDHCPTVMEIQL